MSDETQTMETPKKRTGWPKGKPRKPRSTFSNHADDTPKARISPMIARMKALPNWESEDYVGVGLDGSDRLHIPQELVNQLHVDGVALQWITHRVRGKDEPGEVAKMTRGGWTPVHQSDFDGALDGMFMPKGRDDVITVDDCMLVARPTEVHAKSKMYEKQEARRPMRVVEDQIGRGMPGITGSDHPTATRGNTFKKSYERIEVPE